VFLPHRKAFKDVATLDGKVIFMGKKKEAGEKKTKQKNAAAIDERFKKALAIQAPEENPYKMENEARIERFRPLFRSDWSSIKEQSRLKRRDARPKKPKMRYF
jgi:hypothetical protein